ncbi:hypothetical protein PHMEG_00016964 [Phytophthora megakarya]|uniref:Uncharacterized protein n=1 Tax=Phytophthora megakarya TaxID=4795 RepID=A0A225VZJ3_9STRA|nr:hypothetical protein PHMEG_00016964 [Phytophthora megakarya]
MMGISFFSITLRGGRIPLRLTACSTSDSNKSPFTSYSTESVDRYSRTSSGKRSATASLILWASCQDGLVGKVLVRRNFWVVHIRVHVVDQSCYSLGDCTWDYFFIFIRTFDRIGNYHISRKLNVFLAKNWMALMPSFLPSPT